MNFRRWLISETQRPKANPVSPLTLFARDAWEGRNDVRVFAKPSSTSAPTPSSPAVRRFAESFFLAGCLSGPSLNPCARHASHLRRGSRRLRLGAGSRPAHIVQKSDFALCGKMPGLSSPALSAKPIPPFVSFFSFKNKNPQKAVKSQHLTLASRVFPLAQDPRKGGSYSWEAPSRVGWETTRNLRAGRILGEGVDQPPRCCC